MKCERDQHNIVVKVYKLSLAEYIFSSPRIESIQEHKDMLAKYNDQLVPDQNLCISLVM